MVYASDLFVGQQTSGGPIHGGQQAKQRRLRTLIHTLGCFGMHQVVGGVDVGALVFVRQSVRFVAKQGTFTH